MNYVAGQVVTVTTVDVAHGGWCVARPDDGPVVFVRHALPGETVRARVTEVTSRLARAEAVEILAPSPDRVAPPCPHVGPGGCGGCDWQHATLPAQRSLKAAVIRQQLRRLAGIDLEVTVEPLPAGEEPGPGLGWRTRVQFAVRPDGVAGLRAHRSHQVIDIGKCLIAHPGITDLGVPAHPWPNTSSVEALVSPASAHRALIITPATSPANPPASRPARAAAPADLPANPPASRPARAAAPADLPAAPAHRPGTRPAPRADAPADLPAADAVFRRTGPSGRRLTPVRGRAYLHQRAAGRDWRVSAGAFWQVHPGAADALTEAVLTALEPQPGDTALDLYCGAGLFAGALASAVGPGGTVVGVEADPAAVRDARHNLRPWPWARVHKGDVAAILRREPRPAVGGFTSRRDTRPGTNGSTSPRDTRPDAYGSSSRRDTRPGASDGPRRDSQPEAKGTLLPRARLVVADPPRSGLAREVIDYLGAGHGAARFAYVSCDPATLARDIGLLIECGWTLSGLRAFDAFPMTHHVECVATLIADPSAPA
jgi:tRNA/tmRNA/rRNA uracil-C5-methylase (TrmA/RlmC/RlmD family)